MSLFFFKSGNSWVLGSTPTSFMPTGKYLLDNATDTTIDILPVGKYDNTPIYKNKVVSSIKKNANGALYSSMSEFIAAVTDFFADASTTSSGGDAVTLQSHPASYFQTALGFTPEQAGVAASLVNTIKGGVGTEGDTLKKLYDLLISGYSEITLPTISARNAYNITKLPTSIFVTDDGDGRWALYKATSLGVGASFVKTSDPDLLNAVMTASQIAAAYESLADVNRFTNALLAKLNNLDNTKDVDKPVSTLQAAAIATAISALTKASVGLGNVDNTADANKPVSTAQATAIASAASSAQFSANQQSIINALIFG